MTRDRLRLTTAASEVRMAIHRCDGAATARTTIRKDIDTVGAFDTWSQFT